MNTSEKFTRAFQAIAAQRELDRQIANTALGELRERERQLRRQQQLEASGYAPGLLHGAALWEVAFKVQG